MNKPGTLILVVDDEREILRVLQRSLTARGYRVLTATNGEEALATIAQQPPDLVVLDLLLPGMSGLEVCRQVHVGDEVIVLASEDVAK